MKEHERNKLLELTERAVVINEKLLADEKKFIEAIVSGEDTRTLEEWNEKLNEQSRKEHLYLSAAQSLLQIINRK